MTTADRKNKNVRPIERQSGRGLELVSGFLFTSEISATQFSPKSCIGGFTKLTGYPVTSFLKNNFYNEVIVDPVDVEALHRFRYASKSSATPRDFSYRINSRGGKRLVVNEQVVAIETRGPVKLIGGIVTISGKHGPFSSAGRIGKEKLRLQEMEKLNKHLLEVNQLKDEFLANTSHELRTPLNSIIGFLTLITEGYYEGDEELRLFTRNALDSSYHLLNVINDLLDISKIESGRMQLQIEKVYVDEIMEEIYSLFKVQADQKNLKLECVTLETPLFAAADVRKLKQVLINLVGNSMKFTDKGGIVVSVEAGGAYLKYNVRDTGIGIPKEKQDKLFQKFIQVDGTATRKYGGSGLGLVISKHLVEMMGGEITVESNGAGLGTTVSFTIPKWTKEDI